MDLNRLLSKMFGRSMEPASVVTLKGDASSRRYHRVHLPPGVEPCTLVVMELPADALGSDELTAGDRPAELPFLNVGRHLAAQGLRVPRIHLDAVEDGALLLEDLGDGQLVQRVQGADTGTMRAWYFAAVDLLCAMHRAMWPIPAGCIAAERRFGYDLLRFELDHYREWGAEALLNRTLPAALRARLDAAFDVLAAEVAALSLGFVHRDYQSRNLMVLGDAPAPASLAIIDFQDAFAGPRIYDLVALLNDSYVDVPPKLQEEVIARYARTMGLAVADAKREFHLVAVQRKLKDGGRFVFIDRVKRNPSFLPFVDGSFSRVRRSLGCLPGHEELKAVLAEVDPPRFS